MLLSKLLALAVAILPMALATPVVLYPELEALEQLEALQHKALDPAALVQCFIVFILDVDIVS
jgi:hypothetical protein